MTFLSKGSLVFSVPRELFLIKKIQEQKNIPQIILKEKTSNVGSHTFFQEMLINIKTRYFHSSINHQEQLFHRRRITGYFCPVNIAKFLSTGLIIEHLQKQSFADIPQNRYS